MQQNILQHLSSDNLRVYVVWQRILNNDSVNTAQDAAGKLFNDGRVRHMWDPAHALGFWYKQAGDLEHKDPLVWDAYYLYGAESEWTDAPSGLIDTGSTVWNLRDRLKNSVESSVKTGD